MGMLTVLERNADFTVGVFGHVSMTIWHRAVTAQSVSISNRATSMAAKAGPPLLMSVIESVQSPPSEAVRQAMLESLSLTRRIQPVAVAVAIEAHGFLAGAARSVVSGLFLAARTPHPCRCFGRVEEVAGWFSSLPAAPPGFSDTIIQQMSLLRGGAAALAVAL